MAVTVQCNKNVRGLSQGLNQLFFEQLLFQNLLTDFVSDQQTQPITLSHFVHTHMAISYKSHPQKCILAENVK